MLLRPLAPKQSNIKSADNKRFLILVAKKRGKLAQKRGASHKLAGCGAANKRCCLMQHLLLLLQLLLLQLLLLMLLLQQLMLVVADGVVIGNAGQKQLRTRDVATEWRLTAAIVGWSFCWPFGWPKFRDLKAESGTQLATMVLRPGHLPISLLPRMHIYALFFLGFFPCMLLAVTGFSCTIILTLFMRQHSER